MEKLSKQKYLIYARISPRGGDHDRENSIPMQIEYCKRYIRQRGGEVFDVRQDVFKSGKNMDGRPEFRRTMEELRSGRAEWDILIVYKMSRMSRSIKDSVSIIEELFKYGKTIVSVTENCLDLTTPGGRAQFAMMQVFNQLEREQTVENTINKLTSIAERGEWPVGNCPFGFRRIAPGNNVLHPDPMKSAIVRDIFEMYTNPRVAVNDIIRKYKGQISRSVVFTILRDPVYVGKIKYNGHVYDGKHEPLVDVNLWNKAQNMLPNERLKIRPKAHKYDFLLGGLLRCSCGKHALTPATAKSGQYAYYQCVDALDCRLRIPALKIEEAALNFLRSFRRDEEEVKTAIEVLKDRAAKEEKKNAPMIEALKAEKQEILNKLNHFTQMLANPTLSASTLAIIDRQIEQNDRNLAVIEEDLKRFKIDFDEIAIYRESVRILHDFQSLGAAINMNQDRQSLRALLLRHIDHIDVKDDGTCVIYPFLGESSISGTVWGGRPDLNRRPPGPQPGALTN